MNTIVEKITEQLQNAFAECGYDRKYAKVSLSNRPDLCEYQCNGAMAAAKEYKADVIAEIENSDFNRDVISSCISQAQSAGYTLTVTPSANAEGETVSADVILSYDYKMPVFGIEKTHMTRGIAR